MPSPSNARYCPFDPTGKPLKMARGPSTFLCSGWYCARSVFIEVTGVKQVRNQTNIPQIIRWSHSRCSHAASFFIILDEWNNEWAGTGFECF